VSARRGFTLAELLVGVVLLGVVGAALAGLLAGMLRTGVRVRERAARTATLRAVSQVVARETAGLPADAVRLSADTLRYRARRGGGVACGATAGTLAVREATRRGWRTPQAGRDSVLVHDGTTWTALAITGVAHGTCPGGGAALVLGVAGPGGWSGPAVPAPVEVAEWMELRAYASGGEWWLGARSLRPTDLIQPVAGPVAPRGVTFARTAAPGADTALAVTVRLAPRLAGPLALPADSAVLLVPLGCGAC
jgi:prepilin-type N-terminal cleavage/methylation domain-containing protein